MNDLDLISFILFISRVTFNLIEYISYNNFDLYCYKLNEININDWIIYIRVFHENDGCMIIMQSKCRNNFIILIFDSYDLYNVENSILNTRIITDNKHYVISVLLDYYDKNNIWWYYCWR